METTSHSSFQSEDIINSELTADKKIAMFSLTSYIFPYIFLINDINGIILLCVNSWKKLSLLVDGKGKHKVRY